MKELNVFKIFFNVLWGIFIFPIVLIISLVFIPLMVFDFITDAYSKIFRRGFT